MNLLKTCLNVPRYRLAAMAVVTAMLLLTGCPQGGSSTSSNTGTGVNTSQANRRLKIVCTTGMITDLAKRIGGDRAGVFGMMGPGVDPHLFKARESDVEHLFEADVIFYNGLHLEARLGELLEDLGTRKTVVAVSSAVNQDKLLYPEGSGEHPDPHIWFDVALFTTAVDVITETLSTSAPQHGEYYREQADLLKAELSGLDAYVKVETKRIPAGQRVLVTAHDAFNYFGQAYGFEVVGLQGISTAAEAGAADVQSLVDLVVTHRIPAVFIESSVPERNIQAVQEACRARGWNVVIGGELFSDAMGDAGTPAGTYPGMVRHNVDTIVAALTGTEADHAPENTDE